MVAFKENILKKGSKTIKYGEGLSLELSEKINEYCRENKITPYVFFVALHAIYLYKTVGKEDFMVGTPLLNRKNISEKNMLGMFVSTFPLRFHLNDDMNISELFDKIHTDTFGALKHQRYPYSAILNYAKNIEHVETNLFDTIVSFQNAHAVDDYLDYDKDIEWHLPGHQQSSFELHVTDHNNAGIYYLSLSFSEGIVSQDEAKLVYLRFVEIINYIISHKNTTLQEISYIPKKELDTILHQFNGEYKYKPTKTLIELFEEQAKKTPNSIALKYKDDELTYKELSEKVYNFAVYLKAKGVKPNEGVTLLIHRRARYAVFIQIDAVMAFVQTFLADKVSHIPQGAVIIKEKTGVNAVGAFHYNGVAPRTGRVFGSDYIIVPLGFPTLGHKGVDDVKGSLMITDAGSPEPFRSFTVFIIQLCGPVDPMADLLPVYQIPAVEDRKAGIIDKGRGDHVIILPHSADGRVRVKTGKQWIVKSLF